MARKGIKHNNYTVDFIQEVLEKYYSGQGGFTSLANEYKIPIKTIKTWIYRTNKKINVFKNKKTNSLGRPKEFEINYKERYEILKKFLTFIKAQRKKKQFLFYTRYSLVAPNPNNDPAYNHHISAKIPTTRHKQLI